MVQLPATRISLILRLSDPSDVVAWEEFVSVYAPAIYRLVLARGLQAADAEDVAQEILFAVARAVERFQHDPARARFRTWLGRIARNVMADHFQRRERTIPTHSSDNPSIEPTAANESAWDDQHWNEQLRSAVFERAAALVQTRVTPQTWAAFQLTALEHVPAEEVASQLKVTAGSVYVSRCRVLKAIRHEVERLMSELADVDDPFSDDAGQAMLQSGADALSAEQSREGSLKRSNKQEQS